MQKIEVGAEITAKNGEGEKRCTAQVDVGDSLVELSEQFGEAVVYSHARRSIIIAMQTTMRSLMSQGKSEEEIQKEMDEWKPGVKKPAKSTLEKVREQLASMSPEDRKKLQKELRERA